MEHRSSECHRVSCTRWYSHILYSERLFKLILYIAGECRWRKYFLRKPPTVFTHATETPPAFQMFEVSVELGNRMCQANLSFSFFLILIYRRRVRRMCSLWHRGTEPVRSWSWLNSHTPETPGLQSHISGLPWCSSQRHLVCQGVRPQLRVAARTFRSPVRACAGDFRVTKPQRYSLVSLES